jgi:hypothetical protein
MLRIPENEILSSLFIKKFNMVRYIKNDIKYILDKRMGSKAVSK